MNEPLDFHTFLCASEFIFFFVVFFLSNKLLNIREGFILSYIYAIVCFSFFIYCFFSFSGHAGNLSNWYLVLPILNLTLYKLMDNYILRKFNRHLIFYYSTVDSNGQSWRESLFHGALLIGTIFTFLTILHYKN